MAKITRDMLLGRMFHDPKNFPYGFARSGEFSINEAKALQQYGSLIEALVSGSLKASNDEDKSLLAAATGKQEPATVAEKAWSKYLARINRAKTGSIYGGKSAAAMNDDDSDIDDDVPLDGDLELADDED